MLEKLALTPLAGVEAEIGRWLDALEQVRGITLEAVEGLEQRVLDWEGLELLPFCGHFSA